MSEPVRPRRRRPSWRDPRLGIGVLLIAASVALGSWVVSASDDTVAVWAATDVLSPGHRVSTDDFTRVSVAAPQVAQTYLTPGSTDLEGVVVLRTIGAGELVPREALGSPDSVQVRTVTVPVNAALAGTLHPGARVDLWVAEPDPDGGATSAMLPPELLVEGVEIASIDEDTSLFAGAETMIAQVLIPRAQLAEVLAARTGSGTITIVPVPA